MKKFYDIDSSVLSYDNIKGNTGKDFSKIILYMVICSNEEYQRPDKDLEVGHVKLTTRSLIDDVYKYTAGNITLSTRAISVYLKELIEEGLLTLVKEESESKNSCSIFIVNSVINPSQQ